MRAGLRDRFLPGAGALHGIESVKHNAADAAVEDKTED